MPSHYAPASRAADARLPTAETLNPARKSTRLPGREKQQTVHPGAWWLWALCGAVVAANTTNIAILALLILVMTLVVTAKRTAAPWASAFRLYCTVGLVVIVIRIIFRLIFAGAGDTVLVNFPTITLPGWLTGAHILGPLSAEALLSGFASGLQLAAMIVCVGAANSLANPKRLLAATPNALYEFGTVIIITISVFPQLAESVQRVRRANQLRSSKNTRRHFVTSVIMPVLADALDRSLALAGAMDSRGYGRKANMARRDRKLTSALLFIAAITLCVGAYALLSGGATPPWLGILFLAVGFITAGFALKLASRRAVRTRYRPDHWGSIEWALSATGAAGVTLFFLAIHEAPDITMPDETPSGWLTISVLAMFSIFVFIVPFFIVPNPFSGVRVNGVRVNGIKAEADVDSIDWAHHPLRARLDDATFLTVASQLQETTAKERTS